VHNAYIVVHKDKAEIESLERKIEDEQ
jgi:hypothetical protein